MGSDADDIYLKCNGSWNDSNDDNSLLHCGKSIIRETAALSHCIVLIHRCERHLT